ncbi:MAG: DUF167 domain-containing protein [Candidatus Paceibacterota bacterium]|jgi:uncharacterized protein YggU (UPF0235/DUF167 family)
MYIKVFVIPDAKREIVTENSSTKLGAGGETLAISVREPASGNRANLRVREIIAEREKVPVGKVRILTGHHSRVKMISINT